MTGMKTFIKQAKLATSLENMHIILEEAAKCRLHINLPQEYNQISSRMAGVT